MKPLVNYCRWQGLTLRLRGRDETAVWGQLIQLSDGRETGTPFHFNLKTRELTLTGEEGDRVVWLDEMGVVINRSN